MRKLVLLTLEAIVCLTSSAAIHPDTWHTIKFNGMNLEMSGDYELWTYKVGNDTIIDGKTYAPFYGEETTGGAQSFGLIWSNTIKFLEL